MQWGFCGWREVSDGDRIRVGGWGLGVDVAQDNAVDKSRHWSLILLTKLRAELYQALPIMAYFEVSRCVIYHEG